jgi:hypothetical protein
VGRSCVCGQRASQGQRAGMGEGGAGRGRAAAANLAGYRRRAWAEREQLRLHGLGALLGIAECTAEFSTLLVRLLKRTLALVLRLPLRVQRLVRLQGKFLVEFGIAQWPQQAGRRSGESHRQGTFALLIVVVVHVAFACTR